MQYIVEILRIITWPLLVFWVIFYFRGRIAGFIDRVYQLKFPGGELNAEQRDDRRPQSSISIRKLASGRFSLSGFNRKL